MTHYKHLSAEERAFILFGTRYGHSIRSIASLLGRSASTISRELRRHRQPTGKPYCPVLAAKQYQQNRARCVRPRKLEAGSPLYRQVNDWLLNRQWSPEQISGTLKHLYPDRKAMQVSPETIYAAIYAHPRGELKKILIQSLRRQKSKRGPRGSASSNYSSLKIAPDQCIAQRPEDINQRIVPGHWEGDLIVGACNQSCVGTLVERQTGYLLLSKMDSKSALDVRIGFEKKLGKIPNFLRLSMTYDRGAEMAQHSLLSQRLGLTIYFADPQAPWQRGSSENINGLIRQYLPKGADLSVHSQEELDHIAWLLNTRPRKRFDFAAPEDNMRDVLIKYLQGVALDS